MLQRNSILSCGLFAASVVSVSVLGCADALFAQSSEPARERTLPVRELHHSRPEPVPSSGSRTSTLGPMVLPPTLSPTTWTNIGPAPMTADPKAEAQPSAGRVQGIAADPANANTIFIATSGGGVWKTTDGGTTWSPLTDTQKTTAMGAIAMAPSNSNVVYAGTGTPDSGGNFGRGVLVTTDGGATWILYNNNGLFDRLGVSEIAIDPKDANTAYVATSTIGPINGDINKDDAIWKTTDGGKTWTETTRSKSTFPWSSVRIDQNTSGTSAVLYAAVGNDSQPDATDGVYKSTDGGGTWTLLPNAPTGTAAGRMVVAVSKSDPDPNNPGQFVANSNVVYISASNPANHNLYKFMRSADGGSTFTDLTAMTPNYLGGQGFFDTTLIVDPQNSNVVYVGGSSGTNSLMRGVVTTTTTTTTIAWTDIHGTSVNGGSGDNPGGYSGPHVDHHATAFDASHRFLDGDDGGIWRLDTFDPTTNPPSITWTALNGLTTGTPSSGLAQGIAVQLNNLNVAVAGTQDNGLVRYTGSLAWAEVACGDGGLTRFSQQSTSINTAYAACNGDTGFFKRSDDAGLTWSDKSVGISDTGNNHNFFSPFTVDPKVDKRVVFGALHAWESTDSGDTWTALVDTTVGVAGCMTFSCGTFPANLDAIGLSGSDAKVIYAAAAGHIYVTEDKGKTWTQRDLPASVAGKTVNFIEVFPKDDKRALAVVSVFTNGNGNIFHTTDRGKTWTNITGTGLPTLGTSTTVLPVWRAQFHGDSIKTIYAAADDGVYKTTDTGATWSRFGQGLPNTQVFDMQLDTTAATPFLAIATFGRGVWEIKLPPPTTTNVDNVNGAVGDTVTLKATVSPNGVPGSVIFEVDGVAIPSTNNTYDNAKGVATQDFTIPSALTAGDHTITASFISSDDTKGGNSGGTGTLKVK